MKKKFGGDFSKAPIAMDMKQAIGSAPPLADHPQVTAWFNGASPNIPFASHIQRTGEPYGSNFLFEDGHVSWYRSHNIGVGFTGMGWLMFYKIPLN